MYWTKTDEGTQIRSVCSFATFILYNIVYAYVYVYVYAYVYVYLYA